MKFHVSICALLINLVTIAAFSQDSKSSSYMLRLFEDNDFINLGLSGTDKAYTHGFRADLFIANNGEKFDFIQSLTLRAGDGSVNAYGWGIMQTMITPSDLSNTKVDMSDYRYACSINVLRTRYSSNPLKKYNLQTEYVLGLLGPMALGKETQATMHRLIHDEIPRGWATELKTSVLLNINVAAEKQMFSVKQNIEYIAGAKTYVGTSLTALSVYTTLRIGKMNPYFNGYLSQFMRYGKGSKNWQLYAVFRPSLDFVLRNAHIQGGMFRPEQSNENGSEISPQFVRKLNHIGYALDYGFVLSLQRVSISLTQRDLYAMIKGQTRHEVGNISIYVGL